MKKYSVLLFLVVFPLWGMKADEKDKKEDSQLLMASRIIYYKMKDLGLDLISDISEAQVTNLILSTVKKLPLAAHQVKRPADNLDKWISTLKKSSSEDVPGKPPLTQPLLLKTVTYHTGTVLNDVIKQVYDTIKPELSLLIPETKATTTRSFNGALLWTATHLSMS